MFFETGYTCNWQKNFFVRPFAEVPPLIEPRIKVKEKRKGKCATARPGKKVLERL